MSMTVPASAAAFEKRHDRLVAVDSDGCAMDAMTYKHIHCFTPQIIRFWGLEKIAPLVEQTEQFVNLYSTWRGLNRFPALLMVLDLLRDRPQVTAAGVAIPPMTDLRAFCQSGLAKSNSGLKAAIDQAGSEELRRVLAWSHAVNVAVEEHASGVKPFPSVRAALAMMSERADLIVVSQMPHVSCYKEWNEHGLAGYVSLLGGQELGSKAEQLRVAMAERYAPGQVLMVGDAPGDLEAAQSNGALFFPTIPGEEEASWQELSRDAFDRFVRGCYAGQCQDARIAAFRQRLPSRPPWVA